jgi:hypothetical protein
MEPGRPLAGLPDAIGPLRLHRAGAIGAVYREVAVDEFRGAAGERNLVDPAWIMPRIRAHEAVVEAAMRLSPVFPARFATLYNSLSSLAGFMRRHEAVIKGFLRQVTGQEEWALKVTADLDDMATLDALAVQLWPDWSGYPPGLRYLRLRQERAVLLAAARERAARRAADLVDAMRTLTMSIRPLDRSPAATATRFVADYALLAAGGQQAALEDRRALLAAEAARAGLCLTLSGPWPPYSFRPRLDASQQDVHPPDGTTDRR